MHGSVSWWSVTRCKQRRMSTWNFEPLTDGIPVRVVHGVSITTIATGAIGLSNYRFGRSTTLTYPYGDWLPTSPLEVIEGNLRAGLHTLVLLDLDPTGAGTGEQSPMQPDVASSVLRRCMERLGRPVLEGRDLVLCTDMGTEDQVILTTDLEGSPPQSPVACIAS